MNSMILSFFGSFFSGFWKWFCQSGICRLGSKIYAAVSNSWKNSRLVALFHGKGMPFRRDSIVYKIARLPFTFLQWIGEKIRNWIRYIVENSIFVYWAKSFMFSCMSLNTRFLGFLLGGMSITYFAAAAVSGRISKFALLAFGVAVILCLFNFDLMAALNYSAVATFLKKIIGFEHVDFEFYNKEYARQGTGKVLGFLLGALAGIIASKSLLIGVAVPIGIFGIITILYSPIFGVFCTVFAAPIIPTMALAGLCILTTISFIIKTFMQKDFKWIMSGTGLGIFILLAILLFSSIFSFVPVKSLTVWVMYLVFAGFFFVLINAIEKSETLYDLLKVFVLAGALVALYGVMQYLFGWTTTNAWIDETMFEDATMRVYSTLGNPNVLGEYLLLTLPAAAVLMIHYDKKSWARYIYGAIFVLMALCLVLTQSRGCWIGFMLSAVIFMTFRNGKLWGILPFVIAVLPFVIPQTIVERLLSIGDMSDSSTSYRVFIWLGTMAMMRHYWIGGIGMGEAAFNSVYPIYSYNAIIAPHSHNTFLQILVEAGIGGLIVFVITMVVFIKTCSATYRLHEKKSLSSMTALAIGSGVLGFLMQSMFDYTFYNYRVMCIFFMVLAFGVILYNLTKKEYATK